MKCTVHSTVPERAFGPVARRAAPVAADQAVAAAIAKTARAASAPIKLVTTGSLFWRVSRVGMGGCAVFLRRERCNPGSIRAYVSMINTAREADGNPLRLLIEAVDGGVCVHGVRGWATSPEAQVRAEGGAE